MPKKKIDNTVISGLTDSPEELLIQKSLPLFSLWKSPLSLLEFKILDMYLARIDSRNPSRRKLVFDKGELEKALGVKYMDGKELNALLTHFRKEACIDIRDEDTAFEGMQLFAWSKAVKDKEGFWIVELSCTEEALQYFFNVENIGYLRYKLRSVISIQSRYSYVLFCYLEKNRFRKSWEVELEELKAILNCQEESYQEYKRFNDLILKRCHAELNQKTECKFDYETVKRGRYVKRIRFTVHDLPASEAPDLPAPKLPITQPMKPGRPKKEVIYGSGELGEAELEAIQRVLRE